MSAEQYVLNYSKIYNLQTVSFRLSTIYGVNQYSTYDQGWIGWFINEMINNQSNDYNLPVHGSGKQVRDILYVDDFVNLIQSSLTNFEAIWQCLQHRWWVQKFNINFRVSKIHKSL